jgi:hypothetical protein
MAFSWQEVYQEDKVKEPKREKEIYFTGISTKITDVSRAILLIIKSVYLPA